MQAYSGGSGDRLVNDDECRVKRADLSYLVDILSAVSLTQETEERILFQRLTDSIRSGCRCRRLYGNIL